MKVHTVRSGSSVDKSESYGLPSSETTSSSYAEAALSTQRALHRWHGASYALRTWPFSRKAREKIIAWATAVFVTRPPSLAIFTSIAVAITLFVAVILTLISSQVSRDLSGSLKAFVLVVSALPIALVITISLSIAVPYMAYKSSRTSVALVSSYAPYVVGALAGIFAALWIGKLLPPGYDTLSSIWKWTIVGAAPGCWLLVGLLANHLAAIVDRRRDYERGLEEQMESRHRLMQVHEQTRKEVAGLLHGQVQSRLVVLGHWLKQTQELLKYGPEDALEKLDKANKLLLEIRDQELRSITRQLYPSIIRTGLPSALNSLADRFRNVFCVELSIDDRIAELESPMRPKLNESLRLTVYRVAEEALSNSAKHSQADEATVSLSLSSTQEVLLVVTDNGHGFEPRGAPQGQGLLSMEDYVTAMGGTIKVRSAPGIGTTVQASFPALSA